MSTIKDEIIGIAEEQGYEGEAPKTIAQAVNALGTVIGGGGGIVAFDFTAQEGAQTNYETDATCSEIYDAVDSGNLVFARVYMTTSVSKQWITLPLTYISKPDSDSSPYMLTFSGTSSMMASMPPTNMALATTQVDGPVTAKLLNQQLKLNS